MRKATVNNKCNTSSHNPINNNSNNSHNPTNNNNSNCTTLVVHNNSRVQDRRDTNAHGLAK